MGHFILDILTLLLIAVFTAPSHVPGAKYFKYKYCDSSHKCPATHNNAAMLCVVYEKDLRMQC